MPNAPLLDIAFVHKGGWLGDHLTDGFSPPKLDVHALIEARAQQTNAAGERPLWEGYRDVKSYPRNTTGNRTSNQVRTSAGAGRFYTWLAARRENPTIVEFGSAFGVSGMFWLAGIGDGHLFTFEPNADWAAFARENLASVSRNFTLTADTFETSWPRVVAQESVDIAFVDAIHTGEFVRKQYAILRPLMRKGGLVLFDDINFSQDMLACWKEIAADPALIASATLGRRVGIVEL